MEIKSNSVKIEVSDDLDSDGDLSIYITDRYNDNMSLYLDKGTLLVLRDHFTFLLGDKICSDWVDAIEYTPIENVELLVKSPSGNVLITSYRPAYNIFCCQYKTDNLVGWKWKQI